jgi:hypothetical protein
VRAQLAPQPFRHRQPLIARRMSIQWSFEYEKIGGLKRFKHNSLFYDWHSFCFIRQRRVTPTDAHATIGNYCILFARVSRTCSFPFTLPFTAPFSGFLLIERSIKNR